MPSANSARVLIVDDEENQRSALASMLTGWGFTAETAADGLEALEKLKHFAAHVIVTDLMMPRIDGLTLAKTLKGDPNIGNIPLVMLTAKSGPMDMITGINAGARHYVTKPFKAADLIDKVKKALVARH